MDGVISVLILISMTKKFVFYPDEKARSIPYATWILSNYLTVCGERYKH